VSTRLSHSASQILALVLLLSTRSVNRGGGNVECYVPPPSLGPDLRPWLTSFLIQDFEMYAMRSGVTRGGGAGRVQPPRRSCKPYQPSKLLQLKPITNSLTGYLSITKSSLSVQIESLYIKIYIT